MKKIICLLILSFFLLQSLIAQESFRGMKYQAVARDLKGEILADAKVDLRINLISNKDGLKLLHYGEQHSVVTNKLGLFTLVIGEGKPETGDFAKVPWSNSDIWMEIQIKTNGQTEFTSISNSQMLAVPYAYHAATAGMLVGEELQNQEKKFEWTDKCPCEQGISQVYLLYQGPSGVTIKVYDNKNLQPNTLITTISGVNNGALLTVNAPAPGGKFKNETFFQIVGHSIPVSEIPTACDEQFVGETFGNFSVLSHKDKKNGVECTVCDVRMNWKVGGNALLDVCNWLGTKSYTDVVLITNNFERMRIEKDGNINMNNSLNVGVNLTVGNNAEIGNDLTVKKNASLNTLGGATDVWGEFRAQNNVKLNVGGGNTTVDGPFTVLNGRPSSLTGILWVGDNALFWKDAEFRYNVSMNTFGGSTINNGPFKVANGQPTNLTGNVELNTSGGSATTNHGPLTVANQSLTHLTGDLLVDGQSTFSGPTRYDSDVSIKNLEVRNTVNLNTEGGETTIIGNTTINGAVAINNFLNIVKNGPDAVAKFHNTNPDEGDGIIIKLGRTHPLYNGTTYSSIPSPAAFLDNAIDKIKGWVTGTQTFQITDLIGFVPVTFQAALACNLVNMITSRLNTAIGLPVRTGGWEVCVGELPCVTVVPEFELIKAFPTIDCSLIPGLPSNITAPNISLTDVSNSLSNKNQFIRFVDKDDKELGSVRAQSIKNWGMNFLDGAYFVNLLAGMVGIDVVNGIANVVSGFTNIAKSYNSIGVEYASGHADYAEWLERKDPAEMIYSGDIVGVKGGKVTKSLDGAEQILVVSHNPIILGNAPSAEKEYLGNKIAFTGQVPVKVLGPVTIGDYIIASKDISGYGIAINPNKLSTNDLKLAVGRSWETNISEGPKMVNTLIGIDRGDFLKIISANEEKIDVMESRLKSMEEKMNEILNSGNKKRKKNN